jgi:uncharacterized protein YabE (DUF348 family)/3D (Asp-Asp-Asp) domain-containing protein
MYRTNMLRARVRVGGGCLRRMKWAAIVVAISGLVFSVVGWSKQDRKQVTIVLGHEVRHVHTKAHTVRALFAEVGVDLLATDHTSKRLHEPLRMRDTIVITRTFPVVLRIGKEERLVYVSTARVRDVLKQHNVSLGPKDRIAQPLATIVHPYDTIDIVRVRTEAKTKRTVRAYDTQRVYDKTIPEGRETIVQEGREGIVVSTTLDWFENDRYVRTTPLSSSVVRKQRDRIVAIGTKRPERKTAPRVTLAGAEAGARENTVVIAGVRVPIVDVLSGVSLSAYTADAQSTGKTREHPAYGITKSGTRVREGRTIAVDPDVIPLGWWVYIDGIGLRRAEDTGKHIEGSDIDLFVRRDKDAVQFGRKNGNKVYVIGPNLPKRLEGKIR